MMVANTGITIVIRSAFLNHFLPGNSILVRVYAVISARGTPMTRVTAAAVREFLRPLNRRILWLVVMLNRFS